MHQARQRIISSAPYLLKLTLIDKDNDQEIVMTSSTIYSYSNTTSLPKRLLLRVTEDLNISPTTGSQSSGGWVRAADAVISRMLEKGERWV